MQKEIFMLVLSRRVGETVFIGDDIEVTILKTQGGQIKVGIEAPPEVAIVRKEVVVDDFFSD